MARTAARRPVEVMSAHSRELANLGWSRHFQAQLAVDPSPECVPARVLAVHRNGLDVVGPGIAMRIAPFAGAGPNDEAQATVGDWLLVDAAAGSPRRLLTRKSVFKRRAAGHRPSRPASRR